MKAFPKFIAATLVGAFALLAAPATHAQVGGSINIGIPAWGPQVPYGTQYYYIPEIDGYYDLYTQQYIVYQDGYWVPLPELYGYDPYQFHPVVVGYRGNQPWLQSEYYHAHYAYRPYAYYGGGGYYGRPDYGRPDVIIRPGYGGGYGNRGGYDNHRGGYDDRRGGSYGGHGFDNRGGQYPGSGRPDFNNGPGQAPQGSRGNGSFDPGHGSGASPGLQGGRGPGQGPQVGGSPGPSPGRGPGRGGR